MTTAFIFTRGRKVGGHVTLVVYSYSSQPNIDVYIKTLNFYFFYIYYLFQLKDHDSFLSNIPEQGYHILRTTAISVLNE